MTTFNPSHNPFRASSGRHAQAIHRPSPEPSESDIDEKRRSPSPSHSGSGPSSFPDELPGSDTDSELGSDDRELGRVKRKARRRVKAVFPALPDLRFEQSYLLSIRPYLQPRPTEASVEEKGDVPTEKESNTLVESADQDAVFHWGRDVDVNWGMVSYITLRDQLVWPLLQGAFWGWGTILFSATSLAMRSSLYPPSHVPRGRIVGGPGGSIEQAGGGSAVGGTGWWRSWVKSWGGAVETAVV